MLLSSTVLQIIDSVAIVLGQAYQLSRARLAATASPVLSMAIQRDHAVTEQELLRRELEILRGQRAGLASHKRPIYTGEQRLAIIQLMRLRGWNVKTAAAHFVVHENTIRNWICVIVGSRGSNTLFNDVPWNRIDDAIRWLVHELRRLFPDPAFGTRSIARHILRSGVAIKRTTVQRVLREDKPIRPRRARPPINAAAGTDPHHLLDPKMRNFVWHLDLTEIRVLWLRFTVAAIIDGCTRKLLALKVYRDSVDTDQMIELVGKAVGEYGCPVFLITDHGGQFRKQFGKKIKQMQIKHVRGRVRSPQFNGKVERLFRTFRQWWRLTLRSLSIHGVQSQLDAFKDWYNMCRPHQALGYLAPGEAWNEDELQKPIPIRTRQHLQSDIKAARLHCRDDPHLPIVSVIVRLKQVA